MISVGSLLFQNRRRKCDFISESRTKSIVYCFKAKYSRNSWPVSYDRDNIRYLLSWPVKLSPISSSITWTNTSSNERWIDSIFWSWNARCYSYSSEQNFWLIMTRKTKDHNNECSWSFKLHEHQIYETCKTKQYFLYYFFDPTII